MHQDGLTSKDEYTPEERAEVGRYAAITAQSKLLDTSLSL